MPGYSSLAALGVLMLAGSATAACAQTGPLMYNEQMLRTSLAMFIVHNSVKSGELNTINMAFSESVRDTANQCRKQPDARYFLDALVPALERRRKR